MALLNKDSIKELNKTQSHVVDIINWDCQVRIKKISIKQQLEIESLSKEGSPSNTLVYTMLTFSCVDDDMQPIFESIDTIESLPAAGAVELFKHCLSYNGIGENELEKKAKN